VRPHHIFFTLMAVSSAVTLGKSAALAGLLSASDFADYSATFAIAGLVASAISFGLAEGTIKKFTRLVALSRFSQLRRLVDLDVLKLARRHIMASGLIALIAFVVFGPAKLVVAFAVAVLAFAINALAISASLFRAYDKLTAMGAALVVRTVCASIFCIVFATQFTWEAGLCAEAASSALVGLALLAYFRPIIRSRADNPGSRANNSHLFISNESDGIWLFAAMSIGLIPASLDRSWVLHFGSEIDGAKYAFLAIWLSAGSAMTSIFVQKWGPDFIRTRISLPGGILRSVLTHSAKTAVLMTLGATASFVLLHQLYPDVYWTKFRLAWSDVAATVAALAFQVGPISDWALIAFDGERAVFVGALAFALSWAILFFIVSFFQLGVSAYMLSIGGARAIQVVVALVMVAQKERVATK
jgi:hypothetical protein